MGGKTYHQRPNQVLGGCCVVAAFKAVELLKLLVDELRHLQEVLAAVKGEDHVLDLKLQDLFGARQWLAKNVLGVSEIQKPVHVGMDLSWPKMGQGQVGQVVPDRPVLEDVDAVFRPQNPLLQALGRLVPRGEAKNASDQIRFPFVQVTKRPGVELLHVELHDGSGCGGLSALGAFFFSRLVAGGTCPLEDCMAAALAQKLVGLIAATRTDPLADGGLDDAGSAVSGVVFGAHSHRSAFASGFARGEEDVGRRPHLPLVGLLGPSHPASDPGGGSGHHLDPGKSVDQFEGRLRRRDLQFNIPFTLALGPDGPAFRLLKLLQLQALGLDPEAEEEGQWVIDHYPLVPHLVQNEKRL